MVFLKKLGGWGRTKITQIPDQGILFLRSLYFWLLIGVLASVETPHQANTRLMFSSDMKN